MVRSGHRGHFLTEVGHQERVHPAKGSAEMLLQIPPCFPPMMSNFPVLRFFFPCVRVAENAPVFGHGVCIPLATKNPVRPLPTHELLSIDALL